MPYGSNGDAERTRTRAERWIKALTGAFVVGAVAIVVGAVAIGGPWGQNDDGDHRAAAEGAASASRHGAELPANAALRANAASATAAFPLSLLLADAEDRVRGLEAEARSLEALYTTEVDPLVRGLMRLGDDLDHAKRIAVALVREGWHADIPPQLLLAVISVENPWLELGARSPMGAIGLMQVMPFHAGGWGCDGHDLTDLETNICHGTRILAHAITRSGGDLGRALLAYNGCVHGTNTPDCHRYPAWVLGNAAPGWADGWEERQWVASAMSVGLE